MLTFFNIFSNFISDLNPKAPYISLVGSSLYRLTFFDSKFIFLKLLKKFVFIPDP